MPAGMLRAPAFVQTLSPESWCGIFAANDEALLDASPDAVVARLNEGVSDDIVDALEFIHSHADDGLDGVLEMARCADVNIDGWAMVGTAPDTLAELWVRSKHDARLRAVLVTAQLEAAVREGRRTRYRYVVGVEGPLAWTNGATNSLRVRLAERFTIAGLTPNVSIDARKEQQHVSLYVLRGSRRQRLPLMDDASGTTTPSNIRAASCDLIHLDLDEGRAEIMPSEQRLADVYARVLGEVLLDRGDAFVIEQSFALEALLTVGRDARIKGRADVDVELAAVEWEPKPGHRMTARGRDCVGMLERELKHVGHQRVISARLNFRFKRFAKKVGVTLRPPHAMKCTRETERLEIEELLGRLGLLGSSLTCRLWDFIGPRAAQAWRRAGGPRFEEIMEDGLLKECELDAAPAADSSADGALRAAPTLPGVGLGVDLQTLPRRLTADALVGYELNLQVLCMHLRRVLKLEVVAAGPLPPGIALLGRRPMRAGPVRVFLATAPQPADLGPVAALLRWASGGDRLLLLAPPELTDTGVIDVAPLADWLPPFVGLVDAFYDRLDARAEMDFAEAAGDARLVVRGDGVYLDGKKLVLTPQGIEFVRLVIEHPGSLSADALGERLRIAGRRMTPARTIAHQTKKDVADAIQSVLPRPPVARETKAKAILGTRRDQGYEFLVEARILAPREGT